MGKAPVIRANYPAAREVAETADGLQLFLVGTIDGRESAATFIGFPTPAGNAVWMKASLSYVSTCE